MVAETTTDTRVRTEAKNFLHVPFIPDEIDPDIVRLDRYASAARKYHRGLEKLTAHYLHATQIEQVAGDILGNNIHLVYFNGNYSPYSLADRPFTDGKNVYLSGFAAFPATFQYPTVTPSGLFAGFVGRVEMDESSLAAYQIPDTFGVIRMQDIVNAPYNFHTRLTGKTAPNSPMGTRNLRLLPEFQPQLAGRLGLEELQAFLLEQSTLEEARDVIQRGLTKEKTLHPLPFVKRRSGRHHSQ